MATRNMKYTAEKPDGGAIGRALQDGAFSKM